MADRCTRCARFLADAWPSTLCPACWQARPICPKGPVYGDLTDPDDAGRACRWCGRFVVGVMYPDHGKAPASLYLHAGETTVEAI
jgi:hypothetical protein